MKKVNFKKVLMALTVALTFLFLGVEQSSAQNSALTGSGLVSGNKALMTLPQGSFATIDQAQLIINAHLLEIKDQIMNGGLPQSAINALMNEALFYTLLDEQIKFGNGVPWAIAYAAVTINTDVYGVSASVASTLKQGAVDLLKI